MARFYKWWLNSRRPLMRNVRRSYMTPNPYKPTIGRVKRVEQFEPLGCLEFMIVFFIAPTSGLFLLAGLLQVYRARYQFLGEPPTPGSVIPGLVVAAVCAVPVLVALHILKWGRRHWLESKFDSESD